MKKKKNLKLNLNLISTTNICLYKEIEKAVSSKIVLRAYGRLIVKYTNLQKSVGGLLLVLCGSLGMAFIAFSYGFLKTFKAVSFFFGFANGLVVFGAYLMLSTVTTMADNAYATVHLHQQKLRQDLTLSSQVHCPLEQSN